MNTYTLGRIGLAAVAMMILLALLVAPSSRWLVGTQLRMSLAGGSPFLTSPAHPGDAPTDAERYTQNHPGDYQLQLVQALSQTTNPSQALTMSAPRGVSDSDPRITALRALERRFPNTPSLYANILRFTMMRGSWAVSEGDWALGTTPRPKNWAKNLNPPSAAQLAIFDRDAAQGERLDPDNAYFPFMRAVGLWTANRKTDALAAVERAAAKPAWHEYIADEVEGHWRIARINTGGTTALNRAAIAASILFPHYARLRALARAVTYQAVLTEQAGRPQDGLAMRLALMHCGMTMQTESPTQIGSLVGSAIGALAMARPGGAPPIPSGVTGDEHAQQRLDAFCAYATRLGRLDAVREARQMDHNWRQTRVIFQRASSLSVFGGAPLWQLTRWWAADLVVLANIVLMLVCGLLAVLAMRLPRNDDGEGSEGAVVLVCVLFGVGVFLAVTLVWQWQAQTTSPLFGLAQALLGGTDTAPFKSARVSSLLGMVAVPLLTLLGAIAAGLARRGGLFSGVGRGFRATALPAVCALLVLYSVLVLGTVRQEQSVNNAVTRISQHAGRYMAELVNRPWPGAHH